MSIAIRLVTCPKCRKVLPVLSHIRLYKCGGCGATLQAKGHESSIKGNGSGTNESAVEGGHERLLDQDDGLRVNEYKDHGSEKQHDKISHKLYESCDRSLENEDSSTKSSSFKMQYEEGCSQKQTLITSVNEIEDSHSLLAEVKEFFGDPTNLDDPEATRSSESGPILVVTKVQQNIENEVGKYADDNEDFKGELSQDDNEPSLEDEEHSQVDVRKYSLRENNRTTQTKFADQIVEYSQTREIAKKSFPFSTKDMHEVETSLLAAKNYHVSDQNSINNIEEYGQDEEDEITATRGPLIRIMVFAPLSTDEMYLKVSPELGTRFNRISSEEMLDNLSIDPTVPVASLLPDDIYLREYHEVGQSFHSISSEEMQETLPIDPSVPIGMAKSPTKTYYVGDESESSYDEPEELSAQVSHLHTIKFKGTSTMSTNRSRQKNRFKVKNKLNGQELRHHESPERRKQNIPIRTSMTAANSEAISSEPYIQPRSSQLFHRNGRPESSTDNVFLHSQEFYRPDELSSSDPEKLELLRMVYELEDKINNTHMSKQMSGEQLPSKDVVEDLHTGGYYDDPATGRNPYADFTYFGHQVNHDHGLGRGNQRRASRPEFSGGASQFRKNIDCRCSHCYHKELHFAPKPSSYCIHCEHAAHPRHDYDNMYSYYSPSPRYYTSSEFSNEIQGYDQKYNHEMRMLHLREKHHLTKRHLRPVLGAAPIISCYHCSELLHLSTEFFRFRRRCHQIRCNSCNRILKFILLKKSHLVPYVIKIQAPPSTEVNTD